MINKVFCVYDSKAEAYMTPFHLRSRGEAIRSFSNACQDQKTEFSRHPGDFTLFEIGTYDDSTGTYENLPAKINIGLALDFIEKVPETQMQLPVNSLERQKQVVQSARRQ